MKRSLIALALLLGAGCTQAELVEKDWLTDGDGLITVDTTTGLGWLDLTYTDDIPINDVLAALTTSYPGWRLATDSEAQALVNGHFNSGIGTLGSRVDDWQYHFGITGIKGRSYGTTLDSSGIVRMRGTRDSNIVYYNHTRTGRGASSNSYDGVFLVTEPGDGPLTASGDSAIHAVPITGGLGVSALLLGMGGASLRARRQKNK